MNAYDEDRCESDCEWRIEKQENYIISYIIFLVCDFYM